MTDSQPRGKKLRKRFGEKEALQIIEGENTYTRLNSRLELTDREDMTIEALEVIIPWLVSCSEELSFTEHRTETFFFNQICLQVLEYGFETGLMELLCAESYLLLSDIEKAAEHLRAAEDWANVVGHACGYDLRNMVKIHKNSLQIIRALFERKGEKAEKLFGRLSFDMQMHAPFVLRHIAEHRAFKGFVNEVHDEKLFAKFLSHALNDFGRYFAAGGCAPRAFQVTIVILSRLGRKAEMIETLEGGLDAVLMANDDDGVMRLSLMCRAAVSGDDPLCAKTPKAYAIDMKMVERVEWMRTQYERGDEGKRVILEVTSPLPLNSFGHIELDFIARAALDMHDMSRLASVLDVSGTENDGNVVRTSLVCALLSQTGDWKEARDIADQASRMLFDSDIEQHFAVETGMDLFEYVADSLKHEGNLKLIDSFIGNIKPEWSLLRKHVTMEAAGAILQCPFGNKDERVEKARGLLEGLSVTDRDADWYFLMLRCLVLAGAFKEAKKVVSQARELIDQYEKNQKNRGVTVDAEGRSENESELGMLRSNLEVIDSILKNHGTVKEYFDKSAADELGKSNLKVERIIPNPNGPAIMICSHPMDDHIVRIVAVDDLSFKHVLESQQAGNTEKAKLPVLAIAVPAEEAKSIKAGDWRVLLLDAIGRQLRNEDRVPESGYMVTCRNTPTFPDTPFAGLFIYEGWDAVAASLKGTTIFELVPLYRDECEFAALFSAELLLERLQKTNFWPVSFSRSNCCATQEWRPLIPESHLRPMIEGPMATAIAWVSPGLLQKGEDIGVFYRGKPDGAFSGWVFLAASDRMDENFAVTKLLQIDLNTLANYAPYILGFLDAAEGSAFRHDGCGSVSRIEYATMKYAGIPDTEGRDRKSVV